MVDECDKVMGNPNMRADIQQIFVKTPHNKQVMMFSATMPEDLKKGIPLLYPKIVKNSCKMKSISLSMKENLFFTGWLNSLFTSKK